MGPVRGIKKRRKTEKSYDNNNDSASGSSEKEGVVDWWDEFSKKINGIYFSFKNFIITVFNLYNC